MPLVLLSGQPCSGKSTLAARLSEAFKSDGYDVVVIDEPSVHLDKNQAYKDAASEKMARGLLKSAVDRSLARGQRRVVILDSLNSIKGYRYELWCMARSAATRYCVVHCTPSLEVAREWNSARAAAAAGGAAGAATAAAATTTAPADAGGAGPAANGAACGQPQAAALLLAGGAAAAAQTAGTGGPRTGASNSGGSGGSEGDDCSDGGDGGGGGGGLGGAAYLPEVFDDLACRFEAPDPRSRWDSPLFEIDPRDEVAVSRMVSEVVASASGSAGAPAARQARQLVPTCATVNPLLTATNRLTELHEAVRFVMQAVTQAQAETGGTGSCIVEFGEEGVPPLRLHRAVPVSELRGHRQAFMKIVTQVLGGRVADSRTVKKMYVEYLQGQLVQY